MLLLKSFSVAKVHAYSPIVPWPGRPVFSVAALEPLKEPAREPIEKTGLICAWCRTGRPKRMAMEEGDPCSVYFAGAPSAARC